MLTKVISKLDNTILELALTDAFSDMCFYEGEEFIVNLESYLKDVDEETNTEEQDDTFFELSIPYIENSVMKYGIELYEGFKEAGPATGDPGQTKNVTTGADTVGLLDKDTKNILRKKAGLANSEESKKLTEVEELQIWEGVGKVIYPAAKAGIEKAKAGLIKTGKNLSNAVKSGLISSKLFAKNLKGFKLPKGNVVASDKK